MPTYLGVAKADVIASINDNLALLETYSPGPASQKHIDALRELDAQTGQSKLGAIAAAKTDKELAQAISASGINWVLGRMAEVREFHAYADTDGQGRAAWLSAKSWNGGGGAMLMNYTPVDEECDSWLAVARAKVLPMTQENLDKIVEFSRQVSQQEDAIQNATVVMAAYLSAHHSGADLDNMKHLFLELSLHERHIVNTVFRAIDLENKAPITAPAPIGRFGVVVPELMDKTINWHDPSLRTLAEKVGEALGPFYETNEVQMTGIGMISMNPQNPQDGVMFVSSLRAAQAVAAAMPGYKVVDDQGNEIAKPKAPKPGNTFSL